MLQDKTGFWSVRKIRRQSYSAPPFSDYESSFVLRFVTMGLFSISKNIIVVIRNIQIDVHISLFCNLALNV